MRGGAGSCLGGARLHTQTLPRGASERTRPPRSGSIIMKCVSESAANGNHEDWIPRIAFAAKEVFELMLGCQLNVPAAAEETTLGITSIVALTGQLCGVVSIRCSEKAATLMASKMLGVTLDKASPEVADALGEICNMGAAPFQKKDAARGGEVILPPA